MKTDDLISKLSNELKPVKPWATPMKMAMKYLVLSVILVVLGLLLTGPRYDFSSKSLQLNFWLGISLWTIFCFLGLSILFTLATPGRKVSFGLLISFYLNLTGIFIWHFLKLLGVNSAGFTEGLALEGLRCALVTFLTAVILGGLVLYRVKKGASRRPLISSIVLGLAGLAVGGIMIALNCGENNGMHVFMWHFFVPGIITLALAAAFAGKLLRW